MNKSLFNLCVGKALLILKFRGNKRKNRYDYDFYKFCRKNPLIHKNQGTDKLEETICSRYHRKGLMAYAETDRHHQYKNVTFSVCVHEADTPIYLHLLRKANFIDNETKTQRHHAICPGSHRLASRVGI